MSGRYKVLAGSQSGHCCFDYTVVDTLKPHPVYASQGLFDAICETFREEKAHAVARTLGIGTAHLRPALAELSAAAKAARRPMPPEHLVDAQQDRVHRDRRRARPARTVRNSRRGTP